MDTSTTINLQFSTIKDLLPDFIWEGLKDYSKNANAYQPQPKVLIEKLSKKHNIPQQMIFLTAGIDEAIQIFAKTYGRNAYVFTPTYAVYADVEEFGGKLTRVPSMMNNDYVVSTDAKPDATLIFLANPNNPSGFTSKEKIFELVTNNPQAITCIDEAYAEFTDLSVIDEVQNHKQIVVFRSFSKAFGMAGNRIAFIVAHPDIIAKVKTKTQWANISYLSVGAAVTALDHEEYFQKILLEINVRRDDLINFLKVQKLNVFPSKINAVLLKFTTEDKCTNFVKYLNDNDVVVSHGNGASNMGLDKSFVRITIGTAQQMSQVKKIISAYR